MTVLTLLGWQAAFGASTPEQVQKKVTDAINIEASAQKKAEDLTADKSDILSEIRNMKYKVAWLQYREKQYKVYVENVRDEIANLEFKKTEISKLREQLEPYLAEVVQRMSDFIAKDLTFLTDERTKRIATLNNSLNNYDVSMSEKLRRVLAEGLEVEADYGKTLEAEDTQINVNGNNVQVTTFRMGRVLQLYKSLDGKETGRWNQEKKQWEVLPEKYNAQINRAVGIAAGERTVEVVNLPLGVIE